MTTIREIEQNIKDNRKLIEMADALDRLKSNRDFKKVVMEGYFEKEAVRLVHVKADPEFQTPERQASIIRQIDAIGALNDYFTVVMFGGQQAKSAIESAEAVREDLIAEEAAQ